MRIKIIQVLWLLMCLEFLIGCGDGSELSFDTCSKYSGRELCYRIRNQCSDYKIIIDSSAIDGYACECCDKK